MSNPGACAQVAREGAATRVQEVRERYVHRPAPQAAPAPQPQAQYTPPPGSDNVEGPSEPVNRAERRVYRQKYGQYKMRQNPDTGEEEVVTQKNSKGQEVPVFIPGERTYQKKSVKHVPAHDVEREEKYFYNTATDDMKNVNIAYDNIRAGRGRDEDYSTLGVNRGASDGDIKRAYYKKARESHPDQNPDKGEWRSRKVMEHVDEKFTQNSRLSKGTRDLGRENRRRLREEKNILEEFCSEHPDRCAAKRMDFKRDGFCGAFPERCAGRSADEKHMGGMQRQLDFLHAEHVERKKAADLKGSEQLHDRTEWAFSKPGQIVDMLGSSFYEAQPTSQAATKIIGHALGVQPASKYVPTYRKPKQRKKRMPRRYRMNAANAMRDVDAEMSRIIGM